MMPINAPIFLVGATGTGKSAMGMELARRLAPGAAILAMDAMQVYRGADIGTSKPSAAERAEVPHGGLDLVDFAPAEGSNERFDVAQYLKHAASFLREQRAAGRQVIVVGGTGLYFRALTRGLCEAPQGSDELRAELNALSTEELAARLNRVDPGMVERLDASNPRRLVRAIEVMESTGRSLRAWQEETPEPLVKEFRAFWISREQAELHERIAARVEAMFAQGWVEEVRGLVERYGAEAVQGFAGIGYREIALAMGEPDQIAKLTKLPNSGAEIAEGNEVAGTSAFPSSCGGQQTWERGEGEAAPPLGTAAATTDEGTVARSATATTDEGTVARSATATTEEGTVARSATATTEGNTVARRSAATGEGRGRHGGRPSMEEVKSDILVATRQYAKRQLTWFAREPNLEKVMVSGAQPLPAALLSLL